MDDAYAGRAANEHRIIGSSDLLLDASDFSRSKMLDGEAFVAYFAVPLISKGQVKGILEIFHRDRLLADLEWLDFLKP